MHHRPELTVSTASVPEKQDSSSLQRENELKITLFPLQACFFFFFLVFVIVENSFESTFKKRIWISKTEGRFWFKNNNTSKCRNRVSNAMSFNWCPGCCASRSHITWSLILFFSRGSEVLEEWKKIYPVAGKPNDPIRSAHIFKGEKWTCLFHVVGFPARCQRDAWVSVAKACNPLPFCPEKRWEAAGTGKGGFCLGGIVWGSGKNLSRCIRPELLLATRVLC